MAPFSFSGNAFLLWGDVLADLAGRGHGLPSTLALLCSWSSSHKKRPIWLRLTGSAASGYNPIDRE